MKSIKSFIQRNNELMIRVILFCDLLSMSTEFIEIVPSEIFPAHGTEQHRAARSKLGAGDWHQLQRQCQSQRLRQRQVQLQSTAIARTTAKTYTNYKQMT